MSQLYVTRTKKIYIPNNGFFERENSLTIFFYLCQISLGRQNQSIYKAAMILKGTLGSLAGQSVLYFKKSFNSFKTKKYNSMIT